MDDWSLPADAGLIECCTGIDVSATVEEQSGCRNVAVFRRDMQKRCALKQQGTAAGLAAIEFREASVHESEFGVNQLGQTIQPAPKQGQHRWRSILSLAARLEKNLD